MANHTRLDVYTTLIETPLVPLFFHAHLDTSVAIIEACLDGGARVIEFTNRGDFAWQQFTELARYFQQTRPELVLGIGSVVDAPTAAMYIASGANFIVGPLFNPEVARVCNRRKIAYMPGCGTLSEINAAEALGVEIVKVFPAAASGGPGFIKAVRGPCPWTRIMPTGGVDYSRENVQEWFAAGATCIGMGSKLISKSDVQNGDYGAITAGVAQVLDWIRELKA